MLHVKQIRDIVDQGQVGEAHEALDQLLSLGPNNTEALKLRARLHESEGRFAEEARIWDRIAQVDREDPDAIAFLMRRQLEDREHFYFTDDVPGGGRRFLAYPRALINNSAMGLIGCIAFLLSTRLSQRFPVFADPVVMLVLFSLFVMVPWLSIVWVYFRSLRQVTVTQVGISVATRVKTRTLAWAEIEKVCLAREFSDRNQGLTLVVMPKDAGARPIEINLNYGSSAIRARSYLVREIARQFKDPEYARREALGLENRPITQY